jgi:hypothetical protein
LIATYSILDCSKNTREAAQASFLPFFSFSLCRIIYRSRVVQMVEKKKDCSATTCGTPNQWLQQSSSTARGWGYSVCTGICIHPSIHIFGPQTFKSA